MPVFWTLIWCMLYLHIHNIVCLCMNIYYIFTECNGLCVLTESRVPGLIHPELSVRPLPTVWGHGLYCPQPALPGHWCPLPRRRPPVSDRLPHPCQAPSGERAAGGLCECGGKNPLVITVELVTYKKWALLKLLVAHYLMLFRRIIQGQSELSYWEAITVYVSQTHLHSDIFLR